MNVLTKPITLNRIPDSPVYKALLPDWSTNTKKLARFKRESSLDELHDALESQTLRRRDQQMDVVGHHYKSVKFNLPASR